MNGLDPAGMHEMRAMIASLADEGRTVVLSSHLLDEVQRTCDAVAIVDHGRVIRQGSIDELIRGAGGRGRPGRLRRTRPGQRAHRPGGHRRGHGPDRGRADRHPARRSIARARRRRQPAAGDRGYRRVRPPGGPGVAGGLVLVRDEPTGGAVVTTTEPSLSEGRPEAPSPAGPARRRSAPGCPPGTSSPPRTWRSASAAAS